VIRLQRLIIKSNLAVSFVINLSNQAGSNKNEKKKVKHNAKIRINKTCFKII
jgi:hypothetical protein